MQLEKNLRLRDYFKHINNKMVRHDGPEQKYFYYAKDPSSPSERLRIEKVPWSESSIKSARSLPFQKYLDNVVERRVYDSRFDQNPYNSKSYPILHPRKHSVEEASYGKNRRRLENNPPEHFRRAKGKIGYNSKLEQNVFYSMKNPAKDTESHSAKKISLRKVEVKFKDAQPFGNHVNYIRDKEHNKFSSNSFYSTENPMSHDKSRSITIAPNVTNDIKHQATNIGRGNINPLTVFIFSISVFLVGFVLASVVYLLQKTCCDRTKRIASKEIIKKTKKKRKEKQRLKDVRYSVLEIDVSSLPDIEYSDERNCKTNLIRCHSYTILHSSNEINSETNLSQGNNSLCSSMLQSSKCLTDFDETILEIPSKKEKCFGLINEGDCISPSDEDSEITSLSIDWIPQNYIFSILEASQSDTVLQTKPREFHSRNLTKNYFSSYHLDLPNQIESLSKSTLPNNSETLTSGASNTTMPILTKSKYFYSKKFKKDLSVTSCQLEPTNPIKCLNQLNFRNNLFSETLTSDESENDFEDAVCCFSNMEPQNVINVADLMSDIDQSNLETMASFSRSSSDESQASLQGGQRMFYPNPLIEKEI